MMPNWRIIIPVFFLILLLTRYYDFFYIYQPIKPFHIGIEPTLGTFLVYNYSLKIIFYFFKFITIALILSAGILLEGKTNKTQMASLMNLIVLTIISEYVFFVRDVIKMINFSYVNTNYTYDEYQNFNPLSLFDLLGSDSTSNFAFLFQTINVFEVVYIICLIIGLKVLQYVEVSKAVSVTLSSYGGALLIWILVVTYLTIQ